MLVNRKLTYRMYPNKTQRFLLNDMLIKHQRLYNAALEQRISAYRKQVGDRSSVDGSVSSPVKHETPPKPYWLRGSSSLQGLPR